VLGDQIRKYHGKITPQIAMQQITAVTMTGDNHVVWYDLTNAQLWVAFAAPFGAGGQAQSYWRQFLQVDVLASVAEPRS
jgi:hypothetical protein